MSLYRVQQYGHVYSLAAYSRTAIAIFNEIEYADIVSTDYDSHCLEITWLF